MIRRSRLFALGLTLLACAGLAGCGGLAGLSDRFKAQDEVTKTFKTAAATPRIVVDTFNGEVTVTIGNPGSVKAVIGKWSTGSTQEAAEDGLVGIEANMSQEADAIHIKTQVTQKNFLGSRGANVALQVPKGAVLDLISGNGKIAATGNLGDITAKTSNGTVEVKESSGKLDLSSGNGKIAVVGGAGKLVLHTSNGEIDIKSDHAVIDAQSGNGTVTFSGTLGDGDHLFQTHNGKVTLTLPAEAQFHIDAETKNGKINSDFKLKTSRRRSNSKMQGTIGDDPATTIKIRVGNGSIDVHKDK